MYIERRDVAVAIILTIVTCGLYAIYWMIKINDEINALSNDTQAPTGGVVFLLGLVTCGIYTWIWMYKMGEKLDYVYQSRGMAPSSRGMVYLLLCLFGLGIVSYGLMQDSVNKLI